MLCCSCKKNQATNIYRKITDGKKQTEYYCADCYRRLFISTAKTETPKQLSVCPYCQTTAEDFLASGLVGCEKCYQYLAETIRPVIENMQGSKTHCGKTPTLTSEAYECKKRCNDD